MVCQIEPSPLTPREIVGLDMSAAKAAFAEYLDETYLDSRQIYFVNQIVEFIVHNGMMKDMSVLQEAPFTDQGSIVEVFSDLSVWMGIRKVIEQVNANASVASEYNRLMGVQFTGSGNCLKESDLFVRVKEESGNRLRIYLQSVVLISNYSASER